LLSMTLYLPNENIELSEAWEIRDRLEQLVDLVIDVGHCVAGTTSVINLTGDAPELIREGLGDLAPFGL
jgi:tRNA A37 threonylcarbamoyladenosine synthetase subunit TsaC/SUA5/YrdC